MIIWLVIGLIVWYLIGIAGFIYWCTKDYEITWSDVPTMLMAGCTGPVAWFYGWQIHGKK